MQVSVFFCTFAPFFNSAIIESNMNVVLPFGVKAIKGKIGNVVFYNRNGKQYARRNNKQTDPPLDPNNEDYRVIIESLTVH